MKIEDDDDAEVLPEMYICDSPNLVDKTSENPVENKEWTELNITEHMRSNLLNENLTLALNQTTSSNQQHFEENSFKQKNRWENHEPTHKLKHTKARAGNIQQPKQKKPINKTFSTERQPDRTGLKLHQCEFCAYTSNDSSNMKKHTRIHTGEAPYPCSVCSQRFRQKHHLANHMQRQHPSNIDGFG